MTDIWAVIYNAENRPIRWTQGTKVITMAFDRMGRRVEMCTQSVDSDLLQRFVYDNYLCIQQLRTSENILFQSYVWDPTEPIATRPLVFHPASGEVAYYFHDGNKNVVDLVDLQGSVVHYDYMDFGDSTSTAFSENPYRFSSEVYDDGLGLVYYNYRHYNLSLCRWSNRDFLKEEDSSINQYTFCENNPISSTDYIGLKNIILPDETGECPKKCCNGKEEQLQKIWICKRKLGGTGPTDAKLFNHQYISCDKDQKTTYGVQAKTPSGKSTKKGDPILPEVSPTGTCIPRCVSAKEWASACSGKATMPRNYAIGFWGIDCQEWAEDVTSTDCK